MFESRFKIAALATGLVVVVGLAIFESNQSQAQGSGVVACLAESEAKRLAMGHAETEFCEAPFETEDDRVICEEAKDRVNRTWFDAQSSRWVATLWEGYCAPAAQCWRGVFITCDGKLIPFEDGED